MIEKHRECLRALSDDDLDVVAEALKLTGALVVEELEGKGLCQADVVMGLLNFEEFWGILNRGRQPPVECPARRVVAKLARLHRAVPERPWPRPYPPPAPRVAGDDMWVSWVNRAHREAPGPASVERGCRGGRRRIRLRVGMTVGQLVEAGMTRAEVMRAAREGWVRLSAEVRV